MKAENKQISSDLEYAKEQISQFELRLEEEMNHEEEVFVSTAQISKKLIISDDKLLLNTFSLEEKLALEAKM